MPTKSDIHIDSFQSILITFLTKIVCIAGLGVSLDSDKPHLVGIDEDVSSTGITLYHLLDGATNIGSEEKINDIVLKSASGMWKLLDYCNLTKFCRC